MSYADLSNGAVQGGRLLMFISSLNWILRPQVRLMFELGAGRVSGTAADGNLLLAQLRMGVYYYRSDRARCCGVPRWTPT